MSIRPQAVDKSMQVLHGCCTEKGGLGVTIDETAWPNGLYSDMHTFLKGKTVNKNIGSQHTIAVDTVSQYMYVWTP